MSPTPVLIGVAVAAVLVLLGWQPWRRGSERPVGPLASALAAPAAVLGALYANASRLRIPPREFLDWVLLAGIAAVGLVALRGRRARLAAALVALGAAVIAYVPTGPLHARYWGDDAPLWIGALTASFVVGHLTATRALAARKADGAAALAVAALGSAPALGLSGTGAAALLVAALGGAAALIAGLGLVRRDLAPGAGFAAPFAALHTGLVASGVLFAETPPISGLALVLAPLAALLPGGSKRARAARLAAVVVVVAAAAFTARGPANPYAGY